MPIYLYWGADDFARTKAVENLRDRVLDPAWSTFNYDKITPDRPDALLHALKAAITPPIGAENRLVWLVDTPVFQQCSAELLAELERTLPAIPESTVLLLTASNKPDGRLKSTKLLQQYAEIKEFSSIPPWKHDEIASAVRFAASEIGVPLTNVAVQFLAESVGNNARSLFNELEKLRLYADTLNQPLDETVIKALVTSNTQNSLQLAEAIRKGDIQSALSLVADLLACNEPALKIVATLTTQFRTWLVVKLLVESGERNDEKVAAAAEIGNPKRLYYLRQEVNPLPLSRLQRIMAMLLELEIALKSGGEEISTLQTKTIELCQ